jgi:hypothetical protein
MVDYYKKYLKYKAKYLELQSQIGLGRGKCNKCEKCENWKGAGKDNKCLNTRCGHLYRDHNKK